MKQIFVIVFLSMAAPAFVYDQLSEVKEASSNKTMAAVSGKVAQKVERSPVKSSEDKKLVMEFERVIKSAGDYDQGPKLLRAMCIEQKVTWQAKAVSGLPQAQFLWGLCNYSSIYSGADVEQNQREAVKWFRKAADQGLAAAQSQMGSCFELGRGVDKDGAEAVKWYRKAADQNYAMAQHHLGKCHRFGIGVPIDYVKSFDWELKAAKQGLALAQTDVAHMLWDGMGRPKDKVEACQWYKRAADQNDPEGQKYLRDCYSQRIIVQ